MYIPHPSPAQRLRSKVGSGLCHSILDRWDGCSRCASPALTKTPSLPLAPFFSPTFSDLFVTYYSAVLPSLLSRLYLLPFSLYLPSPTIHLHLYYLTYFSLSLGTIPCSSATSILACHCCPASVVSSSPRLSFDSTGSSNSCIQSRRHLRLA